MRTHMSWRVASVLRLLLVPSTELCDAWRLFKSSESLMQIAVMLHAAYIVDCQCLYVQLHAYVLINFTCTCDPSPR